MTPVAVQIRRLRPDAQLPRYMSEQAAGLDVFAALDADLTIRPGERALVGSGCAIALPPGYEAQVRPRSGLALKHGVTVLNSPGTVDADYRGEVKVLLVNHGQEPFVVRSGERIAQLVVGQVSHVKWTEVENLDTTVRNDGGYGHTGK